MFDFVDAKASDANARVIRNSATRIVLLYAGIAAAYIVVSDRLVRLVYPDAKLIGLVETLKGCGFVGVTAFLLWLLIRRHSSRLVASEAKRFERESLLSGLLDNVGGYIYVKDTRYRYQYGNAAVCQLFGISAELLVGCEDTRFLDAETAAQLRANDRRVIENGERLEAEEEHVSAHDGAKRTYLSVKMPLRRTDGSIYGLCGISTDITERKAAESERSRLQSQLVQAQKMEAIGQLTGGIAHDFNNILASVLGHSVLALQRVHPGNDPELREDLLQIQRAGERASSLVTKMLQFSRARPSEGVVEPLHLQPAIADIIKMLRATIPSNIEINTELVDKAALARLDLVELHQLLTNLMINARDAIDGSGRITVALRHRRRIRKAVCTACNSLISGDQVELSVSDTGHGIVAQTLNEVFEPFYTTKEVGKGTGLGLSVVHGIVHRLDGHIQVSTETGRGTTIGLLFPLVEGEPEQMATNASESISIAPPQKLRVMVVDDEPALVRLLRTMLERNGYQVSGFTDSRAALDAFLSEPGGVDLVITDQTMPGITGIELTREILARRRDLPVLLCSGFSEQLHVALSVGVRQVLAKPVAMNDLFRAIAHEIGFSGSNAGLRVPGERQGRVPLSRSTNC